MCSGCCRHPRGRPANWGPGTLQRDAVWDGHVPFLQPWSGEAEQRRNRRPRPGKHRVGMRRPLPPPAWHEGVSGTWGFPGKNGDSSRQTQMAGHFPFMGPWRPDRFMLDLGLAEGRDDGVGAAAWGWEPQGHVGPPSSPLEGRLVPTSVLGKEQQLQRRGVHLRRP